MALPLIVSQQQNEWHLCNVVETKPTGWVLYRSDIFRGPHKTESFCGECVPSINHIKYVEELSKYSKLYDKNKKILTNNIILVTK